MIVSVKNLIYKSTIDIKTLADARGSEFKKNYESKLLKNLTENVHGRCVEIDNRLREKDAVEVQIYEEDGDEIIRIWDSNDRLVDGDIRSYGALDPMFKEKRRCHVLKTLAVESAEDDESEPKTYFQINLSVEAHPRTNLTLYHEKRKGVVRMWSVQNYSYGSTHQTACSRRLHPPHATELHACNTVNVHSEMNLVYMFDAIGIQFMEGDVRKFDLSLPEDFFSPDREDDSFFSCETFCRFLTLRFSFLTKHREKFQRLFERAAVNSAGPKRRLLKSVPLRLRCMSMQTPFTVIFRECIYEPEADPPAIA